MPTFFELSAFVCRTCRIWYAINGSWLQGVSRLGESIVNSNQNAEIILYSREGRVRFRKRLADVILKIPASKCWTIPIFPAQIFLKAGGNWFGISNRGVKQKQIETVNCLMSYQILVCRLSASINRYRPFQPAFPPPAMPPARP